MRTFRNLSAEQKLLRILLMLSAAALTGYILFSLAWGIYLVRTVHPVCEAVGAAQFPCGRYAAYTSLHCREQFLERQDVLPECTENGLHYQVKLPNFGSFSYVIIVSSSQENDAPDAKIQSDAYEITCPLFSEAGYTYSCMVQTAQTESARKAVNHRFQLDAQQQYCSGQSPDSSFSPQDEENLFLQQSERSAELYRALQSRFGIQS